MKNLQNARALASKRPHGKQRGFTMLEMMIVMAIIAALLGIGVSIYDRQVTQARIVDSRAFFERTFVTAVGSCQQKYRDYNQCMQTAGSTTSNIANEGIETTTPWDQNWSSTYNNTNRQISVTFPTPDADIGRDLAATMDNSENNYVESASASGSTVTVIMRAP